MIRARTIAIAYLRAWVANWRGASARHASTLPIALEPLSRIDPAAAVEIALREITARMTADASMRSNVADLARAIGRAHLPPDATKKLRLRVGMVLLNAIVAASGSGSVACRRFRGHPVWVFHEAGGGKCKDAGSVESSRSRPSVLFGNAA
jgi:hypothetical protein